MAGLFGTLNLGQRSLQAQRLGVEVAGQNLANVNNPAYARQRVQLEVSPTVQTTFGSQGTGVDAVAIQQLRSRLIDSQLEREISVRGFLEAQQQALQFGQANLGQQLDRLAAGTDASSVDGIGLQHGIGDRLSDLFNGFQSWSTAPGSLAERQVVLQKAESLATQFNQVDQRLGALNASLNESVETDVSSANDLIRGLAKLNEQIGRAEAGSRGTANDLRDLRQQKLEDLAELVKIDVASESGGALNVSIGGVSVISGYEVTDSLETFDAGAGNLEVRAQSSGLALDLTSGRIQGTIDARDGALGDLRNNINQLAATLITEVNAIHSGGFALDGTTGQTFFTGSNAADIGVNSNLLADPAALQGSGTSGAAGDNQVALALAQLADKAHAGLNNQTFSQHFGQTVTGLGQAAASVNVQLSDQQVVENMLLRQRESTSGVSLDEEMTDLMKYQKAFQASARLITTVDQMLATVIELKR